MVRRKQDATTPSPFSVHVDEVDDFPPRTPADASLRSSKGARPQMFAGRALLLLVAVAAAALGYGAGRWQGYLQVREARDELAVQQSDAEAQRRTLETRLSHDRAEHARSERESDERVAALEARQQLALSLDALDERNFGTARLLLGSASGLLLEGVPRPAAQQLATDMRDTRVVAADDLQAQRTSVRGFAGRLDKMLGSPRTHVGSPSSGDDKDRLSGSFPQAREGSD